jgi:glycosyltransferase involved in cell wall biosynthesis
MSLSTTLNLEFLSRRHTQDISADREIPRVLLVEGNSDGTVGGTYEVLHGLARHMDRRRYEPVALFYHDNPYVTRLRGDGVEVHTIPEVWARERKAMSSGSKLRQIFMTIEAIARRVRFLRRHRIALLHMNNTPQHGQDDWLPAARLVGIPAITTCAGIIDPNLGGGFQQVLMRRFDRVLPASQHIARQVVEFGYDPSRVTTIYPGIDIEAFRMRVRKNPAVLREEMDVSPDTLLIAMIGNVRRWKGQHVPIEALTMLPLSVLERVRLLIVGAVSLDDAEYDAELRERVGRAGLSAHVTFLGRRDDVPDIMAAADIVLHASVEVEAFGLVVVEAMALGRTVLASKFGGPAEILDAASGGTFDPSRPSELAVLITELVDDPVRRRAMGDAARRRANQFSIEATAEATAHVYDHMLEPALRAMRTPLLPQRGDAS